MAITNTVDEVIAKTEAFEIDPKTLITSENGEKQNSVGEKKTNNCHVTAETGSEETKKVNGSEKKEEINGKAIEEVAMEVEPKTGVSFPVRLEDGKSLNCVGLRKKSMLGLGIKIYGFGVYADNEPMKDLLRSKTGKAPAKVTKEMYQVAVDGDFGMVIRLVVVYSSLTMSMVRKSFDEGLGASIKKLTGGKKIDDLANKVMGQASDEIKLTSGSVIEISRLPGYILQAKVMGEVVSKVESELLCRAFINMYLGDDPFDKEAKEKFGTAMLSLF